MWFTVLLMLTLLGQSAHALPDRACTLEGVSPATEHVLKAHLRLMERSTLPESMTALHHVAEQGRSELFEALLALGFLHPEIWVSITEGPSANLHYRILPGPPMRLGSLELQLTPEPTELHLTPSLLTQGAPFTHAAYSELKNQWLNEAIAQGYLDAQWDKHILWVDPDTNTAKIELQLNTGTPYVLGTLTHDPVALTPHLMRAYLGTQQAQPYNITTLTQISSRLRSSGYFDHVAWVPNKHDHQVDAHLQLTHKRPLDVSTGLGFGTDTGYRVSLSLTAPRLNVYGHHANVRFSRAQNEQHLQAAYHWPGSPPYDVRYTVRYQHHNENIQDQRSRSHEWRLESERPWHQWQRNLSLALHSEAYRVIEDTPLIRRHLLMPSASLARVRADDPLNTRQGYRLALHTRASANMLLHHSLSLLQAEIDAKRITSSGANTVITRLRLGTTWGGHDNLPLSLRFFAGGDRSVRGFDVHELGPRVRTPSGELKVVGGQHLVVGSLEWIGHYWMPWGVGLFADAGNAFNQPAPVPVGLGMQVVRQTPLGPLKAALAHPLMAHDYPLRWRFHLSLGPEL